MPFHVAAFDHYPTDAELEGALAELQAKDGAQGVQYPTDPRWPAAGQWVDSPATPESPLLNGNNTSWLSYY